MSISVENADTYFATTLRASAWSALTDDQKSGGIIDATMMVEERLGLTELDEDNTNQVYAVYEQALYLAIKNSAILSNQQLESERIDGVGERVYKDGTNSTNLWSVFAIAYLRRLTGGIKRFSRG